MEDAGRLVSRVRERDVGAFESLYDAYHRLVYGIAVRMLSDSAAAEDLTQSVFMKLWASPESFRGGNFAAWIARVARNRAIDSIRTRATRAEGEMLGDAPLDLPLEGTPEDLISAQIDAERVRAALATLPEDQRQPIELGFFEGITHEEIARRTATPLGTIKTRIRTGLRKLRTSLEGEFVR